MTAAVTELVWSRRRRWGAIEQKFLRSLRARLQLVGVGRDTRAVGARAPAVEAFCGYKVWKAVEVDKKNLKISLTALLRCLVTSGYDSCAYDSCAIEGQTSTPLKCIALVSASSRPRRHSQRHAVRVIYRWVEMLSAVNAYFQVRERVVG